MQFYFFDTSALIKYYAKETGSQWVKNLCDSSLKEDIYIAVITQVEVISAIAGKKKQNGITVQDAERAYNRFTIDLGKKYNIIEFNDGVVTSAVRFAWRYQLRGYDAVQLASVYELNTLCKKSSIPAARLISSDKDLNNAARTEGITVEDPNNYP
jgi:uncharacterized protein